jgi:hypothetical protein
MRNEKIPLDARLREFKFRGNLVNISNFKIKVKIKKFPTMLIK